MEEKIKIKLPEKKIKEVKLYNNDINVCESISLENFEIILSDIRTNIFEDAAIINKATSMYLRYIYNVLELCSNVDMENIDSSILLDIEIFNTLAQNISNFNFLYDILKSELQNYTVKMGFGMVAESMPSSEEMEKSMEIISKTVENIPQDKLELIAKSIAWNQSPALGGLVAPVEHIKDIQEGE